MIKLDAELVERADQDNVLEFLWALLLNDPANAENLFVILGGVDRHGHVVVRRYYLDGGQQIPWEQSKVQLPLGSLR